ncbi:hypothetical protein LTS16_025560 [Friedmanniomyces endolithicus]|nr:hypothetical protein LTR57_024754 [Friedmanniomyces endolithicus]KAK0952740.1 hypothetical protein LTS01_024703 [Friedmanniomyces endolithicus]KAK1022636.1 hypothetical protein LTS16_025560 [Friedmanniomyces endolithicus]
MRLDLLTGLASLAAVVIAQNSNSTTSAVSSSAIAGSTSSPVLSTSSAAIAPTTSSFVAVSSAAATAITVALDGSAQFTAINAAIAAAQNSAIPSVVVKAGTYSESIVIQGTQTVSILGPSASSYAANQVVIAAPAALGVVSFNTQKSTGVTFKNVNITNTGAAGTKAPAVSVAGVNMGFYNCALVSPGIGVYTATLGTAIIANSYIEGTDKLFYNYVTLYVYGSTIVPTVSSATLFYAQGYLTGTPLTNYNSSIVVDSSSVQQKAGLTNTYVYLAGPNGDYTNAIFRNTNLGSLIAPTGVRTSVCNYIALYGEFANTGAGAMNPANAASKNTACDQALTVAQLSYFTIDQLFGHGFPGASSYDTTWVDSSVLSAIQKSDAAQTSGVSSVVTSSSVVATTLSAAASSSIVATTSSSILSSSSTFSSVSDLSASVTGGANSTSGTPASTSSILASTTSSIAASTSSAAVTAVTVGPSPALFTGIDAAVSFAQNSGVPSVVVAAGTYPALSVVGTQTVTISGPTATAVSGNQVVISSSGTAGSLVIGSNSAKGVTFRNLNFTNTAITGTAPAVSMRGLNMGFYGCALVSGAQGAYSASYGISFFADSYIEGTDKLFYNYPTVYLFRSTIVPTGEGTSIVYAKGATISGVNYNASVVLDSGSVVAKPGLANSNVYLATPNQANNYVTAVYRNSALGSLIAAGGVYSTSCSVIVNFGEFANTGAGSYSSNAASRGSMSCDYLLSASQVSAYTVDQAFGNSFTPYANSDTTWIDSSVLSALQASDAAQIAAAPTSSSASASATLTGSATTTGTPAATCAPPAPSATLVVSQNATACQYANVSAAISALPNDSEPYTIFIYPGTYNEQLSITRNGKVTLIGQTTYNNDYTQNQVVIVTSDGQLTSAGKDEITPVLSAKKANDNCGMAIYNINFINTYPQTTNTAALAADFYGAILPHMATHSLGSKILCLRTKCYIASNTKGACMSAQSASAGDSTGYVFDSCHITYTSTYGSSFGLSYLGRPYSSFSKAIVMNSFIDKHINAAGWSVWSTSSPQTSNVTFGEYNNTGLGSWQAGTQRASFATALTDAQAGAYTLSNWLGDTSFMDMTAYNLVPSYNWTGTITTGGSTTAPAGPTTTATINAHPQSGTVPPPFAVLVSSNGAINNSYANVTAAITALPNDNTNQTIFIYPGTYVEQLPIISRPGAINFIGSTTGNPGQSYKDNAVTITFARGLSVSPLPVGQSDAETATLQTASNRISFYNINIINTENLDGSDASYVTLAASIYGNDIGFYACSFNGWQDTLLNGATAGYQYYESCYIGGAIDFIWGYSKAYFKGCTIGAKRASSAMTAQSRASAAAVGGYIFDQCLFTQAPDATVDLTNKVYLGRPYSQYALVVIKNSYIDKVIIPAGWKIWAATDPRTGAITFAEFNNTGPSNWENNVAARTGFGYATLLTSDTYSLASVMDSTSWIDMTYWNSIVTPQPTAPPPSGPIVVGGNSTYNGTTPPSYALLVSQSPIDGKTVYPSIQAALNAAPTDSKTNATIFIYPGTYNEQIIVNKSGSTIFIGYSSSTDDYSQNQVTIQQSYGEDTQGTGSDVDAATVYATGNQFYAYNVNFRNNNGTQQTLRRLALRKYAFMHACQIYGNQDTLYISGFMFTFKTYIEGNIDFIFGAGQSYFLNSTIAPNEDGDSITAQKRASNTTAGGFVFDQCSIIPALGVDGSAWTNVSLGRPWNNNSQVIYVDCYLGKMIGAPGWDQWSKSSPQTQGVAYGEYHNYGPGSSTCGRVPFSFQLTDAQVVPYQISNFFLSTIWIDKTVLDVQPFQAGIGSAPAACVSSSTVSSSTATSSTLSGSSTSLPLVTEYTTKTVTSKLVFTTTISNGVATSVSTIYVTESDETTVTPSPMLKTSVVKATSFAASTVTQAASTATVKSTETIYSTVSSAGKGTTLKTTETQQFTSTVQGKGTTQVVTSLDQEAITVQGKATTVVSTHTRFSTVSVAGKGTTIKSIETIFGTTSITPKPTTVKATTTIFIVSTSTPAPVTITNNQGGVSTVYSTSSVKAATTTSTLSLSGTTAVKTTSLKGTTTTITVSTVATSTKKTTITCQPSAAARKMFRRGPEARAAGTTTLTVNATVTSFTKTSVITLSGSVVYTRVTSTSSVFGTSTLKATTSTVLSTSYAYQTSVVTESAAGGATTTQLATKTSLTTVSAPASTAYSTVIVSSVQSVSVGGSTAFSTVYQTSYSMVSVPGSTATSVKQTTSVTTVSAPASTVTQLVTVSSLSAESKAQQVSTSYIVITSTSTTVLARQTSTVVNSAASTTTILTTAPQQTSTAFQTVTAKGSTVTSTVTGSAVMKTTTVKSTSFVTSTATTSKSGAGACPTS